MKSNILNISISILLLVFGVSASAQNFGCYELQENSRGSWVYSASRPNVPNWSLFKIENPIDGPYQEYYKTSKYYAPTLKMEGQILNGKKEGYWKLYDKKFVSPFEGDFVNGKKEGAWRHYYIDQEGDTINLNLYNFKNDSLDGMAIEF